MVKIVKENEILNGIWYGSWGANIMVFFYKNKENSYLFEIY